MDLGHSGTWSGIPRCALPSVHYYSSRATGSILIVDDEALVRASGSDCSSMPVSERSRPLTVMRRWISSRAGFGSAGALLGREPSGNDRRPSARPTGERPLAAHWHHQRVGTVHAATPRTPCRQLFPPQTLRFADCGQACPRNDGRKPSAAFRPACGIFAKMAWLTDTVVPWGPLETSTRASSCCASAFDNAGA